MPSNCRYKVLLAEDDDFNRQLTCAVLEGHGCSVTMAEDGGLAVELCREQSFDLILMDICMPVMDGHEATRSIRLIERARGGRTPIFALTADASPEERQSCMDSGMDDVLAKPVSFDDLMKLLASSRQDVGVDAHPVVPPGPADEIGVEAGCRADVPPCMKELFSERILADFGAGQERLATYFGLLCNDIGAQIAAMDAALEAGDHAGLRMAAHAAKGVARGLRDQELSLLAEQIENQARNNSLAGIKDALSEFSRLFRSISCI